ncbi:hypothetical protein [Planotetraspora sp. GP83]|uniref:hypothetical protein n=1 Tax=Planotetraspora sp. GP83 TaxID=3156264 RepID=UPI003518C828
MDELVREIQLLLGDSSTTLLTTLFDYYGLPGDLPGMATRPSGSPYERVAHVERGHGASVAGMPLQSADALTVMTSTYAAGTWSAAGAADRPRSPPPCPRLRALFRRGVRWHLPWAAPYDSLKMI